MKRILMSLVVGLALGVTGFAQVRYIGYSATETPRQAANFIYGSVPVTFAGNIGFKVPGIGGGLGGEFQLPANFAVTEDFRVISEQKRASNTGKLAVSTTGVQYHFQRGFFTRAAVQIAKLYDERDRNVVVYGRFGGGVQFVKDSFSLPTARFTAEYFTPFKDDHGSRGVSIASDGYFQFSGTALAVGGKVSINYARFHDLGFPNTKRDGVYTALEGRIVLNISSLFGE